MGSPAQADIVNELYSRRDSLPADKRAVVEELHTRFSGGGDQPLSTVDKIRNYMGTGDTTKAAHLPTDSDTFSFPPWLNAVGTAAALGSGAQALGDLAEMGLPAGAKAVGAFAKGVLAPKPTGRIARGVQAVRDFFEEQAASKVPDALRTSAQGYDAATAKQASKQLNKFTPGSEPSGRSYKTPKTQFNSGPGTPDAEMPGPPPNVPPSLQTSAEGYDPRAAAALAKRQLQYTPGAEPSGRAYAAPKTAPVSGSLVPEPAPVAAPKTALETSAEGYNPAKAKTLAKQQLKYTPGAEPGGGRSYSTPSKAPQPRNSPVMATESAPVAEPELPESGAPKRAPRKDPDAQKRSEEIQALNRHADTIDLAKETVGQGVKAKDLLALPPEARQAYMTKIGLGGRSDATWRTYIGHVLRAEKLKK